MEKWLNKHYALLALVGGTIATIISVTVYAMTTFSTKEELKYSIEKSEKVQTGFSGDIYCTCSAADAAATSCVQVGGVAGPIITIATYAGGTLANENNTKIVCVGAK